MDSQDEAEDTILKANCSHEVMEENLTDAERMSDIREENEEGNSDNLSPDTSQSTSNLPQFYERGQPTMAQNEQSDTNSDSDESSIDKGPDSEEVSIADSSTVGANSTQDSLLVTGYSIMSPSHSRQTSIADSETYLSSTPDSVRIRSIDSRFQTRLSSLSSPNSHGFKREQLRNISQVSATDNVIDPAVTKLEAIRWTKLRKLSSQVYSDSANVSYGQPTVVLPCSTIAIGTEKGVVLIFDYHQNLLHILGQKQRALEWGAVTALCISSDQMFIGVGYAYGHITTWDIRNPQSPYIHIRPLKSVQSTDNSVEQLQGHLQGVKILHLSFLGKRRTALISGDVNGMAFFHDSKRSFMARTTKSIRLLGRYPDGVAKRKPTTIFGCSPRPIGIESERIDELGLIAIMTPYMMAIISTNSQPRTHFKVTRDKSSMDTMGLSGCLAWFPSLKSQPTSISKPAIPSRLAYSWSNILKIVTVSQIPTQIDEIGLNFNNSKKFVCDEGIVAIQWINRQVRVVTTTQRLLVINESTMTITTAVDLLNKHIMHHDYFSRVMADQSFPISDAYFNTLKAFKGRLFLMGKYEFVIGSLSSWADRLLDAMESGDNIGAVRLAVAFYLGEEDLVSVGLPTDTRERQDIVLKSLCDLVFAALTSESRQTDISGFNEARSKDLFNVCLTAVLAINDKQSLLGPMFDIIEDKLSLKKAFFDELTSFIYDGEITFLPPKLFKDLEVYFSKTPEKLEDLICRLNTSTLDLDLTFLLCKRYDLKDTEIYIWNMALNDYIGPLQEFSNMISEVLQGKKEFKNLNAVYPYLSYILTGRIYPTGLLLEDKKKAFEAKCKVYNFLFSGSAKEAEQDGFQSISNFIEYDCSAFFIAMNEVFEDPFLNEIDDYEIDRKNPAISFGSSVNRQFIVNFFLDFFSERRYSIDMKIFLDIFIARNYSKYSQFLMLPGITLNTILTELSYVSKPSLKEECELALHSLLSSNYKPPDLEKMIAILYQVGFYSVLQFIYKGEQRYDKLLEVTLKDDECSANLAGGNKLMTILDTCLVHTRHSIFSKQRNAIDNLISENFSLFVTINCGYFVELLSKYAQNLHDVILQVSEPQLQIEYLQNLFNNITNRIDQNLPSKEVRHLYITLLAKSGKSGEINRLLNSLLTHRTDVDLPCLVDVLIETKSIDILVILLLRHSRVSEAMIYLIDYLQRLQDDYYSLAEDQGREYLENKLMYYTKIGLNICSQASQSRSPTSDESESEALWIRLLNVLIDMSQEQAEKVPEKARFKRNLLQLAISSLLDSSGSFQKALSSIQHNAMVVRIFRSILLPSTSQLRTLGCVRPIVSDLFAAYNHQNIMCTVAKEILDSDAYLGLMDLVNERLRGWKISKTGDCEGCGRKVVGVGIDAQWVYENWEKKQHEKWTRAKIKGKAVLDNNDQKKDEDILIVFKCEHTYHLSCLKRLGSENLECVVCQGKDSHQHE